MAVRVTIGLTVCLLAGCLALAQSAEQATQLASRHPAFAEVLAARDGWQAAAYDTHLSYGNWRVQFWHQNGKPIGWAEVNPDEGIVYGWQYQTGLNDAERNIVREPLLAFIRDHPEVQAVTGSLDEDNFDIGFHNERGLWTVQIKRGAEAVRVFVRPGEVNVRTLEGLEFSHLIFPNVPSFDEWQAATEAEVIALAFADWDVAQALREVDTWRSELAQNGEVWQIDFVAGERLLATAQVDAVAKAVLEVSVAGN